jgi:cholest-4-en-3-one 26-monooxygenase
LAAIEEAQAAPNPGETMQPVDLSTSVTFERGMPHEYFSWLRDHEPVHWQDPQQDRVSMGENDPFTVEQRGFWVVSRHSDIIKISLDQKQFSSERGASLIQDMDEERIAQMRLWMINQDAPGHTKLRKLVNKGFTKRMIQQMDAHVRVLTKEILDKVAHKGECDFVSEIASELPLLVIAELVGCPVEDRGKLFNWSNTMIGFEDPDFQDEAQATDSMLEMLEYANHLGKLRKDNPKEDLTSVLMHAELDGERLDELSYGMFFVLLILAGNETTRNAISGGMLALSDNPDQRSKLVKNPSLITTATEEILRFVSPVIAMRRTATRDTEIAGQAIRENDKVVMFYPAANRDEAVFENAQQFDITRDPNPHLAFGWGPHFCLGASLARAEISCMFTELLARFPDIEVSGPVRRLRSSTVNSIKSMPVRFTPER